MPRRHVELAPIHPIAARRDEAAAALGVSVETFDKHVRPYVRGVDLGGVTVYPLAALADFVNQAADINGAVADLERSRRKLRRDAA